MLNLPCANRCWTYHIGEMESWVTELEMLEEGVESEAVEGTPRAAQVLTGFRLLTTIVVV